jgi:two-component system sensor histidine kinase GlrK
MRLTIFWRMAIIQFVLLLLFCVVSFSVFSQLHKQSGFHTDILTAHAARVAEEQRLLDIFLFQRRSVEKFLLLRDPVFLTHFEQGDKEFHHSLDKVTLLIRSSQETALVGQIRTLYARYSDGLTADGKLQETWRRERLELSDRLIAAIHDLIQMGETQTAADLETAKRQFVSAPPFLGWSLAVGLGLMIVLLYFYAQSVRQPLNQLIHKMQRVSQGDFHHSLRIGGPSEVAEVARSFNMMVERLSELDEMQGDFLAQMSHELRTPLTAIQEGSALLLEGAPGILNASQREIVQVVRSNSERLFRRLESLLDLSKMEARKMEYSLVPIDLVTLVRRSVEAIGPSAQKKQLQVRVHTPAPLPVLYADEDRIRQVLDNLLNNAMKFTPERGTIHVSTSIRSEEDTKEHWADGRVQDSGVGIPPEDVERIFHKFYQSSSNRKQAW